ncbi:beta-ketoacyl-[acyl-carrier-protein] synthase family protein [Myroides marinus]|uniref:beta-ketoacyl-[acyl-carrier-protein] synthase family protein n=1 Tax=Myroides marinus TaxID=703342 RepID=UPI002574E6FD|nr:beta-ketoacyl-[acyl-carrier-protein] synthase family protein [Myroides marinus]MDM1367482.1 beta-ketoacyl-[acyl-carrier-protein] synthase family protein [Myroides marinus]MDM1370926.1 beta-ketoacyl-[acyl-carrier-protein] synthase family protein [Myroides marinus]MDM1373981.1 beta-ketoacyl-[acyl-carrier-protein] synthase family protein [Myroides marinus]MDM1383003.1 beta-ketoacyl-[acyl-carrier-protein] synthase family protein [Myroides marinus]MDM1388454.1 beta-ketoacyl-[acyl-carrier-protein
MQERIVITGMGIISAIGNTVEENYNALLSGQSGVGELTLFESIHRETIKVGQVKKTTEQLIAELELSSDNNYTRTALLGAYAAKEAIANAGIRDINNRKTGLISSTSVGGMDYTEKYFFEYETTEASRKYIDAQGAGDSTDKIADYIGLKGFVTTISTACSSAANAVMMGARLLKAGKLDRVIVGGTDALSKFTVNGFNTLMILTDGYNTPFDQNRKGLNLGEAAAYLVLEREDIAIADGRTILGVVSGYANANDAYHQTASSENGEGAYLAMQKALKMANLSSNQVDYVNAHGTATPNNDLSEGRAMQRIFTDQMPLFSSTKPYTGHTLAAAGAIEAVYSLLAIQHGVVFPNKNFVTPMEELSIRPQTTLVHKEINTVLSNSFGFGGNCSTVIFSKF